MRQPALSVPAALFCSTLMIALAGCSKSATDAQIVAATDGCVKKQEASAKFSTAIRGNATSEQQAQIQAAIAESQQAHSNLSKEMCAQSVTEICKRDAKACSQLASGN
jgi:hypothetical protein